jgi:mRNA interferase MazF
MNIRAGDVYYANLDPVRGTEQRGTRPVIIISTVSLGPRAIVVPTTSKLRNWRTRIRVNFYGDISDAVCEQVRTIDLSRLHEDRFAVVPLDTLQEIQNTVAELIGVY